MGSKAFPQALISIPRTTPFHVGSNFSTLFPYRFNSTPITLSRVSSIASFLPRNTNRSLVLVRAEATPQSDEAPTPEDTEAETEDAEEAEEVEEAEPKPSTPYKPRVKLGDIMGILNKRAIEAQDKLRPTPDLRTGDIVEIKFEVPENRRRSSIYKGIVISKQNAGIHTTIRIRRIVAGVGVEIVFPVYSPNIKEIKVIKHRKVRRARLYYLRDKLPRFSTFK